MRGTGLRTQPWRGGTGSQAVDALQTEPIVCRWASNGPTAGHKGHSTLRLLPGLSGTDSPLRQERLPYFVMHRPPPHSQNFKTASNFKTSAPSPPRRRKHATRPARRLRSVETPNARSRRPRKNAEARQRRQVNPRRGLGMSSKTGRDACRPEHICSDSIVLERFLFCYIMVFQHQHGTVCQVV